MRPLGTQSLKSWVNSIFNSVTYRLGMSVVDPGDEQDWSGVKSVLLTHAHFDHIYGLNRIIEMTPSASVYTNRAGMEALLNDSKNLSRYHDTPFVFAYPENIRVVDDGDEINLGDGLVAEAHFTPGHNPGCITWVVGDSVYTGDSYIPGIKTVTNLPGSDKALAAQSELLIKKLAEGKQIFPGHKI